MLTLVRVLLQQGYEPSMFYVLYVTSSGFSTPLSPPEQVAVDRLWNWRGQPWGSLSDGTLQDDYPTHS
ncbi:hypothetical protein [Acaryochloris marina]|uniref:hypothetical protein n=1 Tax=Acaryochloris marina TaxID=155978 RepID=UPI0021C27346|nr:hypothetical protein [Acaryochloris marina]